MLPASIEELTIDEVLNVLREEDLPEEILKCFEEAEIDGSILLTMTRSDFSDMFRVLRVKRAVIEAWKKVTGLDFDADGNPTVKNSPGFSTSTPTSQERRVIESAPEEEISSVDSAPMCATADNDVEQTKRVTQTNSSSRENNSSPLQEDWLRKYQLPTRFSCAVEAGLSAKFLSANLRNEMVRDVCTNILNHTTRPKKNEREAVAKMITERYPFLRDHEIHEDTKPWGSLEEKIMNRFKKLQRRKSSLDTSKDKNSTQGGRPTKKRKTCWTEVPESNETEEDVDNLISDIKQEWKQSRKNHEKIKELMSRTYPRRREIVLVEVKTLPEVLAISPPMTNMLYIKADIARIMGSESLPNEMKERFKNVWSEKILKYAKKETKYSKVLGDMENAIDSGRNEQECNERAALKLASVMLRPPNRKGQQNNDYVEAVIKVVLSEESLDSIIQASKQPVILIADNLYSSDIMYVVGEGVVISEITTNKISDALVIVMSMFYMFNIDYKIGRHLFNFIEMAVMNITPPKCPVSVSTFVNIISSLDN